MRVAAVAMLVPALAACASLDGVGRDLIDRVDPSRGQAVRTALRGAGLCIPVLPYFNLTLGSVFEGRPWPEGKDPALRDTLTDLAAVLGRLGPPTEIEVGERRTRFRYRYHYGDFRHSELDLCIPYVGWYRVFEWESDDRRFDELLVEFDAAGAVRLWSYRREAKP